jgi:hypothetical protein
VIDGLERLGHHAVVGSDYQHDDIGDFSAARAHAREGFMAGCVDEDNLPAVLFDVISADVLGDAAGLAFGHVSGTDGIQQRCFAVIDVTHDGNHGRAPDAVGRFLGELEFLRALFLEADFICGSAEFARDLLSHLHFQVLINGGEDFLFDQLLDDQVGLDAQLFGQFLDGDAFRNRDFAVDGRRRGGLLLAPRHWHPQSALFLFHIAMAVAPPRFGLMAALLFGGRNRRGRFHAQGRSRMQCSGAAKSSGRLAAGTHAGPAHHGLSGTNGAAINRLAGNGRGAARRHAGTRRARLGLAGSRPGLLQLGDHVWTRRNHGTSGWLTG